MAISFNQIPNDLRVPLVSIEIDNTGAVQGTPALAWKILVLGQRTTSGTQPAGQAVRVTKASQAEQLFGADSMLADMFRKGKAANSYIETWAIALDDNPAGAAASMTITVDSAATGAGTLYLLIGGEQVSVGVASGDTAENIAQAIIATVNANPRLPVSAAQDADPATVKLTCVWAGLTGNDIDVRLNYYSGESTPPGVTLTIGSMAGGTANPDIVDALAAFGDEWWNSIVMPYTDTANLNALEQELLSRWGPLRMIDAITFSAYRGSHAATGTFGNGRNGFLMSCMGTNLAPQPAYLWAMVYGVIGSQSLSIDPARPLQTLVLPGILPPAKSDRWDLPENNLLLHDGIATHEVGPGDVVQIQREISLYQKDSFGLPDESYLDINTPATLSYIRYATRTRIQQRFPRHKLADDGTRFAPGQAVVTPSIIRNQLLALFTELEEKGLVENFERYKETLIVERNADNRNRLDVLSHPDLVNQFRLMAMQIQFVL
ncbi:phage tail sheath subtilisin-like domain-containing protein [Pseudomonas resinovorans]|uniref:Phage tail sheath subtilisin-like domain-containing protein n=1 Tax=Metapseudomonas resinovorans TaxID=53412 RepID=A0ABT4Y411_METRE|nr:phage tail sheath subtilisin-like domain-containing protein [Pseudomonas resinovorans]MDA8483592.1 phage tail sheath subtilisin-like domain-containing protein [Pseudomonas resinovorans]